MKRKPIPHNSVQRVPCRHFRANLSACLAGPGLTIITARNRGEALVLPCRQSWHYGESYRGMLIAALEAAIQTVKGTPEGTL